MRAPWLGDILRAAGLTVVEVAGWRGRGREMAGIDGVVAHHTATGTGTRDEAVANLLRVGRSDLAGPLSQLGLDRQGRFWLIADGRCNHNGYGEWGNNSIGIEAFNSGVGEPWPSVQVDAYQRGAAAILTQIGLPASRVKGHKETDPGRKIDPAGIDMNTFRARVADLMEGDDVTEADLKLIGLAIELDGKATRARVDKQTDQIDRYNVWQMRQAGVSDADIKRILDKNTLPAA